MAAMPKSAERKRFGIYYTPPQFTQLIVEETLGNQGVLRGHDAQRGDGGGQVVDDLDSGGGWERQLVLQPGGGLGPRSVAHSLDDLLAQP